MDVDAVCVSNGNTCQPGNLDGSDGRMSHLERRSKGPSEHFSTAGWIWWGADRTQSGSDLERIKPGADQSQNDSDWRFPPEPRPGSSEPRGKTNICMKTVSVFTTTVSMEMVSQSFSIQIVIFRHFTFRKCHTWRRLPFTAVFRLLAPPQTQSDSYQDPSSQSGRRLLVEFPVLLRSLLRI